MHYPTVKQLRYFLQLVEREHFGRAAEDCHVSQSAFSSAIKELEETLGVSLVDRTNKSVTVTRMGTQIAKQAAFCVQNIEELVLMANAEKQPLAGPLHIGIIPTIAPFVLPRLLPLLMKQHPKLELNVTEDLTENIYQKLMLGQLDVLLLALPYELANTQTLSLFEDDFYLACNNKTRFVSDPEKYSLSKIKNEAIVLLQDGHCLTEHAIDACQLKRSDKISQISPSTLQTLVQMVHSDLGVSFLPALAIESNMLKNTNINVYKLTKRAYREVGLAWRRGSGREAEFSLLGERVCEAMQK